MAVDPVEAARQIGKAFGREDLTENILSGDLTANDAMPLLGGMLDMCIREMFEPIAKPEQVSHFHPHMSPMVSVIRMKDGTALSIILEATQ